MTTQLDIANRSLLAVGARTYVSSISPSDGSAEADAISVLWTPTYEALGRAAHWNCLRKQVSLALLQAAQGTPENQNGTTLPVPETPWLYAYAYPSDCLQVRYIVPSFPANQGGVPNQTTINNSASLMLPTGGQIPYQISSLYDTFGNVQLIILTNQSLAQVAYTVNNPNPAVWDSSFQAAMVSSLAAYLVPALNLSLGLMQVQIKNAESTIIQARVRDGNEGVSTMDHTPDWIRARAGGSNWGLGYNISLYGGYCNMTWPAFGGVYGD